jgi:hypothetical protein
MGELTDKEIAEYFHRSYTAVDGLWFMKVEEKLGFDAALEIDDLVWRVLPKIQARTLKGMLNLDGGMDGLSRGITERLGLEGFEFEAKRNVLGFAIIIRRCPWHDMMVRSGRAHFSDKVSSRICRVENTVWANEFGSISFELDSQICRGEEVCSLLFHYPGEEAD